MKKSKGLPTYVLEILPYLFLIPTFFHFPSCYAQACTDSISALERTLRDINLPLVIVDTENGEEPTYDFVAPPEGCMGNGAINKTKVKGRLRILLGDSLTFDSGDFNEKKKKGMKIRIRGNGSALSLCKPYKVKFQKKCDLLFRGDEDYNDKNWALLNFNVTRTLRTETGFFLATLAGMEWQPAHQWVNLMLNGKYQGVYWICETVRRAKKRCDISKSGFIVECDPYWWTGENIYFKTSYVNDAIGYTFKYPDEEEDLTPERIGHISNYFQAFEDVLTTGGDVSEFIDMESFARWILLQDLIGQHDGYGSNIFFYKDDYDPTDSTSSKMKAGPLWDLEAVYNTPDNWCSEHGLNDLYFMYLLGRKDFVDIYHQKWTELRDKIDDGLTQLLDSINTNLADAINQSRQLTDNPYQAVDIDSNIGETKAWFAERIPWMDTAIEELVTSTAIKEGQASSPQTSVTVYDLSGKIWLQASGASLLKALREMRNNKAFPHGVYIVRTQEEGKAAQTLKWIK